MSSDGITSAPCVGVIVFAHFEEPKTPPTKVSVLLQKTLKVGSATRTLLCSCAFKVFVPPCTRRELVATAKGIRGVKIGCRRMYRLSVLRKGGT